MVSPYPVLKNRPIDQWKVTELKEELKRRKLMTKGLKDDLIRRLDEALRVEAEISKKDVDSSFECEPQPVAGMKDAEIKPVEAETSKDVMDGGNKRQGDDVTVQVIACVSAADVGRVEVQQGNILDGNASARLEEIPVVHTTTMETNIMVSDSLVSEVILNGHDLQIQKDDGDSKSPEHEDNKPQLENTDSKFQLEIEDLKLENEDLKAPCEDQKLNSIAPDNQVSEVSPILGSQVKSDSISSTCVSINEKIELKDNIITDNIKLEVDIIKSEMVEPSSSVVDPVDGVSHLMDVTEPHEDKASLEEKDDDHARNEDTIMKNDSADLGYSEKLNLDRSSGDESMDEDMLEGKQSHSKYTSDEMRDRSEKNKVPFVTEEDISVDIVGDDISDEYNEYKKDDPLESKNRPSAPAEKRKLHDEEASGSNEPLKKQRRSSTEIINVPKPQGSNLTPIATHKDAFRSTSLNRSFSRTDSTNSIDAPKDRVVPPSEKPPTESLKIDRFLRPFTLKAVQELLGKTGTVTSFWMDQIKTHCYVTYSSIEEAIQTRNAVYNLQWPPNGGHMLLAEFVDPQEVKMRVEAPTQTPSTAVSTSNTVPLASPQPKPSPRQQVPRLQPLPPPPSLPPPPPLSNPPQAREQLPPPPPVPEKLDPHIITLDDLFRKTKSTPRIYYLPLSEEQVVAKVPRGRNI